MSSKPIPVKTLLRRGRSFSFTKRKSSCVAFPAASGTRSGTLVSLLHRAISEIAASNTERVTPVPAPFSFAPSMKRDARSS